MTSTDYALTTKTGALIFTTPDRKRAIQEAEARAEEFPGLRVVRIQRTEERYTVWTEARLRLVSA